MKEYAKYLLEEWGFFFLCLALFGVWFTYADMNVWTHYLWLIPITLVGGFSISGFRQARARSKEKRSAPQ